MPGHTGLGGPPLVRLLARLASLEVRGPAQPLPELLSQWLGWSDAIALATALKGGKATVGQSDQDASLLCEAVRTELTQVILDDELLAVRPPLKSRMQARRVAVRYDDPDYMLYRQCYVSLQQRMEISISTLREDLRARLASSSTEMSKLAAVDVVMEQALMEKERGLLASIPSILEVRFTQLRDAAQTAGQAEEGKRAQDLQAKAWLDTFRQEMQRTLLAELDMRMLPIDGLQAALQK